jgi:hypothetical protein
MSVEADSMTLSGVKWTKSVETMLARWCDQAKCFEWMHAQAFSMYDTRARIIMISSNVLTAVSGLSNVIAGGHTWNGVSLSYVFGSLSIFVSITNMLQEKLAYGAAAIEHRQYSNSWGIIRRKIEEELSIPPESRKECATFLNFLRQDINKVSVDGSAKIPEFIMDQCYEKFSKIKDFDVPDICGHLEHTKVYVKEDEEPLLRNKEPKIDVTTLF